MTFGERIIEYRKKKGLSQEVLAQQLGVSRQSVSKWERDESMPEAEKLPMLAKALGVSLDTLLTGEAETPQAAEPYPVRGGGFGRVAWLFRRWGWIGGLILSLYGAGVLGVGALDRYMIKRTMPPTEWLGDGFQPFTPYLTVTTIIMAVGGLVVAAGLTAALVLYHRRPGKKT